jgi:hypothetical protein
LASPSADSSAWTTIPAPAAAAPAVTVKVARAWMAPLAAALVGVAASLVWLPRVASNPPSVTAAPANAALLPASFAPAAPPADRGPSPAEPGPARIALSVEHRFERGRLRVFVDDTLALDRRLTGRPTRHLLVLKRQAGSMGDVLEVPAGSRVLRFEVDGNGIRRTGRLRASFRADQTRLLRLKADKRIELEWQS